MTVALGVDTGGTYSDAVLVDLTAGKVLAAAKALTTRPDLSRGIQEALATVFASRQTSPSAPSPSDIDLVALSTTLATNAIAEGKGSPIRLLLIGYDPDLIQQYGFQDELVTRDVVYLRGGHDVLGNEVAPLDEDEVREAILARPAQTEAFAVSGYFGVRNPTHELRVRALVEDLAGLPVTCGHELSTRLNAVRRATTVALNARLIPLLRELVVTVADTLRTMGVAAPLMVVKGDGSLVLAEWAMQRPIETILSGPAASVVGAWHLAGRGDVWVVDVGGTTTDIAALRDGHPRLNPEGAQVGRWRTMVEAVDVHTVGLGGDSHVRLDREGRLVIGPQRVIPLCLLASEHPQILGELRQQSPKPQRGDLLGQFVLAQGRPGSGLSQQDQALLDLLAAGPQSLYSLGEKLRYGALIQRQVGRLESRRMVLRAGFTPTDALHALGDFLRWEAEAAQLGAEILAARAGLTAEVLCQRVVAGVSNQAATELVSKVLSDEATLPDWEREPAAMALLRRALGQVGTSELDCRLRLRQPIVAVGAPVEAYMPRVAEQLCTELTIPDHAEVANAVGAVAGGVVQRLRVIVHPLGADEGFRLHLPAGVRDFATLEEAVAYAQQTLPAQLVNLARQAGAEQVEVQVERQDQEAPAAAGWQQRIFLKTVLTFTAVGRPSLARCPSPC